MKTLLLASALFAGLFGSLAAVPVPEPTPARYHAFCRTMWLFGDPCTEILTTLVTQIQVMTEYTLVSADSVVVKANHTSPESPEGETLTISLSPTILTGGCRATALSTSNGFTSLFDGGQNYCNLYNLVSASSLMSEPGFMELTNEWACLSYKLATCS
ncbi:hypothetical protein PBY51_021631 [Eleginops maclovinus]|uniref:Uncharacterized protein n=1 Tax=Eleginops maclovinus TaxID=56733 RepID=A0AAN7XH45_ELEMC|nr:hypothetical protein PBY51_021631 [Eleginops maclovinus]